ncbi:MAG: hypothetical protein KIS78_07240 [Labilithrix sp.]|nr:hypothetical protein [Labilithrix sp.]MCW5832225.1 hypothetical protein [Labilithrix sp.]
MSVRPTRSLEKAKRIRGLVRVWGYFFCVMVVCGLISIRHARAEYQDQTLLFGRQMVTLAKASNHEVTKVIFNGQPVHVGSSVTEDSAARVLERYEEYCKANRGQMGVDFTEIDKSGTVKPLRKADAVDPNADAPAIAKAGYVRSGSDEEGAVICFVKGPKTKPTTGEAFQSFMTTGELGAIGELRYAYASKGPSGKTLVLTVWTDSAFNLRDMVPEDGQDAAGEDFAEVPRVPNATRIMAAKADGMPYGVNVYKTTDAPAKTFEFFDREMKRAGWFAYDPEMTEAEDHGQGRAYMKDAVVVTLGTSVQPEGNFVAVGLAGVAADDKLGHR